MPLIAGTMEKVVSVLSTNRGRLLASAVLTAFLVVAGLTVVGGHEGAHSAECDPNEPGQIRESAPALIRTTDTDIVHTRIGGTDFYIPRNYFRHPQIGCGVEEPAMLLRVLLPDLKPYSEETAAEYAAQLGFGDKLNILLTSDRRIPLDELALIYLEGSVASPPSERTHGMFHGRHRHGDDVFVSRTNDVVLRLIRCSPVTPDRGALCGHHFQFMTHDVQITYQRTYLPNWAETQESVERILESFAATSSD